MSKVGRGGGDFFSMIVELGSDGVEQVVNCGGVIVGAVMSMEQS